MSEPFRSDLDAARARADILEEQNDELREEVVRLRQARGAGATGAAEDPAVAKLAEETLERLDEMTHAIELLDPAPPVASSAGDSPHPPGRERRRDSSRSVALEQSLDAETEIVHLRAELVRALGERDLARALPRAPAWRLFSFGLVLGLLVGALLGSLR